MNMPRLWITRAERDPARSMQGPASYTPEAKRRLTIWSPTLLRERKAPRFHAG
jgi:hypothetical protein